MRWLGLVSVFAMAFQASGCGKEVRTAFEGVYCSHEDEDPMYECAKYYDLVCISTDRHVNQLTGELGPDRYLCRQPCKPGQTCPEQGVCCPGMIYGKTFDTTHACVPFSFCANPPPTVRRDGGVTDARATDAGDAAGSTDVGGATDGGVDAGGGTDTAADGPAPADDAAADAPADMELADAPAG